MEGQFSDAEKQQMIVSFVEVAAGQTPEVATQFLQAANWRIEEAMQLFFAGQDSGVSAPSLQSPAVGNPSPLPGNIAIPNDIGGGEDEVRPPLPVVKDTLYGNPMPTRASRRRQRRRVPESGESSNSAANRRRDLGSFDPPPFNYMFRGSFQQAKVAASAQDKWLLVNVQSLKESNSTKPNLDSLSDEAVATVAAIFQNISTHFIFWQEDNHTSEGQKVRTFYKLDSTSVVLVIDPITGQKMKSWCGTLDALDLLEGLVQFRDGGSPRNNLAAHYRKRPRESSSISRDKKAVPNEDDEVQKAIAASLEGIKDSKQLALNDNEASSSKKAEETSASKLTSYPPLPEEPQGEKNQLCRVGLRLPDGRRIQRNFLKDDPIQLLWSFSSEQLGEAGARQPFRLTQAIPGAKSLDYESKLTMAESGIANSMIVVAWE